MRLESAAVASSTAAAAVTAAGKTPEEIRKTFNIKVGNGCWCCLLAQCRPYCQCSCHAVVWCVAVQQYSA
jgi:hypothetical protein